MIKRTTSVYALYWASRFIGLTTEDNHRVENILRKPTKKALKECRMVGPVISYDDHNGHLAIPNMTFAEDAKSIPLADFRDTTQGDTLRSFKKRMGFTIQQTAEYLGVNRRTFESYLYNRKAAPEAVMQKVAA